MRGRRRTWPKAVARIGQVAECGPLAAGPSGTRHRHYPVTRGEHSLQPRPDGTPGHGRQVSVRGRSRMTRKLGVSLFAALAAATVVVTGFGACPAARHDVFHHQRRPGQRRRLRRPRRRRCPLRVAGQGRRLDGDQLAGLSEHDGARRRRRHQCPRPDRQRTVVQRQGRDGRGQRREAALGQRQRRTRRRR